jgi:uncharacterized membrane protein YqhA
MLMKRLLENGKYLILVVVIISLALCLASLVWGIYEAVNVVINLFTNYKGATATIGSFVQLMDIFLIVAVLYIFTVAMYELFIGELDLPQWLAVHNFDQLKSILGNMVVLIMAVAFLKYFLERNDPVATVLYAAGVAVVSLTLILYRRHEPGDSH